MAISQKLDKGDLALAIIMQDPILCMEFLRSTGDLAFNKELWPKKAFKYRPYQKDLISDKSPYISLEGGRSIGKCQLGTDKVYTVDGYKKLSDLARERFRLWAWNEKDGLVPRNAYCWFNGYRKIWTVKTQYGKINATKLHPILTDEGWKFASEIQVGDRIVQMTKLPQVPAIDIPEHEVRMLAYMMFKPFRINNARYWYPFKSNSVRHDVKIQMEKMGVIVSENELGELNFSKRKSTAIKRHPLGEVLNAYGFYWIRKFGWNSSNKQFRLPEQLRRMNETNLKQFFESFFAEYADISSKEIRARIQSEDLAKDMQECLLRFGIETKLEDRVDTGYTQNKKRNVDLVTRDKRAVYRALKEFNIPGYALGKLTVPEQSFDVSPIYKYETVTEVTISKNKQATYALNVDHDHTYISNDIIVHNTYILEDKILWDILHNEELETPQVLLATANQAQMTPVLNNINTRFLSSTFLRGYVKGKGINKQDGTMKFDFKGREVTMHARLAGMKTESNMVEISPIMW